MHLGLFAHLIHSASPARRKPAPGAITLGGGLGANSSGHVKTLLASSSAHNLASIVVGSEVTLSSTHPTATPVTTTSQWFSNLFHSSTGSHPHPSLGSGKPKTEPHSAAAALAGVVLPSGNIAHPANRRASSHGNPPLPPLSSPLSLSPSPLPPSFPLTLGNNDCSEYISSHPCTL